MTKPDKCTFCDGEGYVREDEHNGWACTECGGTGVFPEFIFTCCKCRANETCKYAWDNYNTNDDCLMNK